MAHQTECPQPGPSWNVFWMKNLVLFYTMAAFKHLSKQARCWLDQINSILYVLLAHSDSYQPFCPKSLHTINQLLTRRDSSHSWKIHLLKQLLLLLNSWAFVITNSTLHWQQNSFNLRAGPRSSAWKPMEPSECTQRAHAFPGTTCTF